MTDSRESNDELAERLDAHIRKADELLSQVATGKFVLPNGLTTGEQMERTDRLEQNQEDMMTALVGPRDPLTRERSGGMRGDIGELKLAASQLNHQITNGGVNAKVKLSSWQKAWMASIPFVAAGVFAVLQALIERG